MENLIVVLQTVSAGEKIREDFGVTDDAGDIQLDEDLQADDIKFDEQQDDEQLDDKQLDDEQLDDNNDDENQDS